MFSGFWPAHIFQNIQRMTVMLLSDKRTPFWFWRRESAVPGLYKVFLTEPMMRRRLVVTTTFFAVLFSSGCTLSIETVTTGWRDVSNVPVVEEDIDYSYPVTGAVAQGGAIVFKSKPGLLEKLFYNPAPHVPADESEIVVCPGLLHFNWKSLAEWIPPERSGGTGALLWGGETDEYAGKCDILFGNASSEGELRIRKHQSDQTDKNSIIVVLDGATTGTVSIAMNNFIASGSTIHVLRHMPPYSWGEFVLSGRAYRIFSVVEEAYYAKYPDFSQRERGINRNGLTFGYIGSRVETTAGNFLRKEQKFQILDNSDAVVAELQENNYTLYDTLPQTEWDGMKQALALFHAFRRLARGLL
jgi:hypothetical protein